MKQKLIFHPVLMTLYPLVSLYIVNQSLIRFEQTILSFGITLAALACIWLLVNRLVHNNDKSALIVSTFFLLFFFFGHFINTLIYYGNQLFGVDRLAISIQLSTTRSMSILLAVWIIIFGLIVFLTIKSRWNFQVVTDYMNILSILFFALSVYKTVSITFDSKSSLDIMSTMPEISLAVQEGEHGLRKGDELPDIYYIILDGYARSDVMREIYDYDNTDFLEFLREQGFYVAEEAHSNYNYTYVSLTSALNLMYLDELTQYFEPTDSNVAPIREMYENNRLASILKASGYTLISLPSPIGFLTYFPSDVRLLPVSHIGEFEIQVVNATPLRLLLRGAMYEWHRQWIQYQFQEIPIVVVDEGPKFVYAHIMVPHPPFVFKANGDPTNPPWEITFHDGEVFTKGFGMDVYLKDYKEQAIYATERAELLIGNLMAMDPRPIIVVQSDHGPGSRHGDDNPDLVDVDERFSILNAYYFPDHNYTALYPEITPVNSFRVVLNRYLGTDYELLADRSYWINSNFPYNPTEVSDRLSPP